jgi:hypothetical protein
MQIVTAPIFAIRPLGHVVFTRYPVAGLAVLCAMLAFPAPARAEELVGPRMIYEIVKGSFQRKMSGGEMPPGCISLSDPDHGWNVQVRAPGTYCLATDLKHTAPPPMLRLPHQPIPTGAMLQVVAPNVSVDLLQHTLRGKTTNARGIWANRYISGSSDFTRISNGTISTNKQPAVFMGDGWNDRNTRFHAHYNSTPLAVVDTLDDYRNTGYVLEDLTLQASEVVVILQGRNNTIRRCKIIGGNGTVNLYGPGLVFEDNDIILDATEVGANGEAPVALYLEDADGSIVRHNRFTLRGRKADAEAIVLKNSANVTVQGNTVNGGRQTWKLLDQASSVNAKP